ncbi:hypothetical protein ACNOYE_02005 [Nannocystaceae bacterium ST9]
MSSCLLARLVGEPELASICAAWMRELEERGRPWIRPLRGLPRREGLICELHAVEGLDLRKLTSLEFESDEVVTAAPERFDPSSCVPERHLDRLSWAWTRGEASLEPNPRASGPDRHDVYPRFDSEGWGPAILIRSPDDERIALACPDDASAYAHASRDGSRFFVYGTLDEYTGGFVWILDADTLAILRTLTTERPVGDVHECERADLVLVETFGGLVVWEGECSRRLPFGGRACLSPSGRYIATIGEGLRVWTTDAIDSPPLERGFEPRFDPSGTRLLHGTTISEGRTGATIATIEPDLANYLEGGPALPWVHFGARWLICIHGNPRAWATDTGESVQIQADFHLAHWYMVAYDRAGERLAAVHRRGSQVELYELPSGRSLGELEAQGTMLALSPDAGRIAVRRGLVVEVWTTSGTLLRRFEHPAGEPDQRWQAPNSLRFSDEGRQLASFVEHDGWRIWALDGEAEPAQSFADLDAIERVAEFANPRPCDWDIDVTRSATTFEHRPTNTTITLPAAGPWAFNPSQPEIAACPSLHVELRAGRAR